MRSMVLLCAFLACVHASLATSSPPLFAGRCGIAVTEAEAENIASHKWLDDYDGSIGFWYNWDDHTKTRLQSGHAQVPFLPMWWGSQVFPQHEDQQSWCSNAGYTHIPKEEGPKSVVFGWNEPIGGYKCNFSMGACPGGDKSGLAGAKSAAQDYSGCIEGAKLANRFVSTPCLNSIDPAWFREFRSSLKPTSADKPLVCCSHIYATLYNGAAWDSCDMNAMTDMTRLTGQLQSLADDGTCDYHFIQEIGIGGCSTADAAASELLIANIGNAVRDIPSVYLGWFANSQGDGGTARKTTWLFEENHLTIGHAYRNMCSSLKPKSSRLLREAEVVV